MHASRFLGNKSEESEQAMKQIPAQTTTKRAFTLVELVFIIIIIGILSSLATPKFGSIIDKMRAQEIAQKIRNANAILQHERMQKIMRGQTMSETQVQDLALKLLGRGWSYAGIQERDLCLMGPIVLANECEFGTQKLRKVKIFSKSFSACDLEVFLEGGQLFAGTISQNCFENMATTLGIYDGNEPDDVPDGGADDDADDES